MKVCEHEFENANCTNCANGLPSSAYECAKTKGLLKEYVHERASEINRLKYNEGFEQGYQQGKSDRQDEIINLIQEMQERAEANMMFKQADACERIIAAIKREQSNG